MLGGYPRVTIGSSQLDKPLLEQVRGILTLTLDSRYMSSAGPSVTRRSFLQWLGAVGGSAVVFDAMMAWNLQAGEQPDPPDLMGRADGTKVAILGAGVAGLTAAYELGKVGYDCRILEARDRVGGRNVTARRGHVLKELGKDPQTCEFDDDPDQYLNYGPWRIPQHHTSVLHYAKEFNVPLQVFVNENDGAWVYREGVSGPLSGKKIRRRAAKADTRGYAAELLAKATEQDALDMPLSKEDKEKLLEYLVEEGYLDSEDRVYRGTGARGYEVDPGAGLQPGQQNDPYDFSALLQGEFGSAFESVKDYDQQPTMFQPVGGMDQIPKAFEEKVGHKITYSAEVQEIRHKEEGVQIIYKDRLGTSRQLEADYCICTIPLSVLQNIPNDFSKDMKQSMEAIAYTPTGKMGLQFKRRFWEEDDQIYGGHTDTNLPIFVVSYPSYGFHKQKGIVLGYYNFGSTAIEVGGMPHEQRVEHALKHGSKIHDQYRKEFETGFSVAWHLVPYSQGGWASHTSENRKKHYPRLNEPDGRVYLAGEHLSYLTGWQAGGIESAWKQIEKLHKRVKQNT